MTEPVLHQGDHGGAVCILQRALNLRGAQPVKLVVDGIFGGKVFRAVEDWQHKRALPVTGIVNQPTWASLDIEPPAPVARPASLALYCHVHGQPDVYSQGSDRWQGIADHVKAWNMAHIGDCSAFYIWLYYACGWPDPTGQGYSGLEEYTGTLQDHGTRVVSPAPNDAVLYAPHGQSQSSHVAIYVGSGMVVSHGIPGPPQYVATANMGGLAILEYRRYAT